MKLIRTILNSRWVFPFLLFGIVFITYGYQVTKLGWYWDDWEILYINKLESKGLPDYSRYSYLFSHWFYAFFSLLLGTNAIFWQIFNILLRWAGLFGFWWAMRMVWPKRAFEIAWICMLLAVYPAFSQHSAALATSSSFAGLGIFSLSLGLNMLALLRQKSWIQLTAFAVFASLFSRTTIPYFWGLEILRPFLIWVVLRRISLNKSFFKEWVRQWMPYILTLSITVIVGLIWFPSRFVTIPVATQSVSLSGNFLEEIIKFGNQFIKDFIHLTVENWISPLDPDNFVLNAKANWFSWFTSALVTVISILYLFSLNGREDSGPSDQDEFSRETVLFGVVGFVTGSMLSWSQIWSPSTQGSSDQLALSSMLGSVLLLVGIVHWFSQRKQPEAIILGIIFVFAMSSQMQLVNKYRLSWEQQKDFFWQLTWRVPDIKPGTAIVSPNMPFAMMNDVHVGYALNTIYDKQETSNEVPYWFFSGKKTLSGLKPGESFTFQYKSTRFNGNSDQILVADFSNGSNCLHIFTQNDPLILYNDDNERTLEKKSNQDLIDLHSENPVTLPAAIFGAEPDHGWCYSYQKMENALQDQDWEKAALLADEAEAKGFSPKTALEYTPLVLAYMRTHQNDKAIQASLEGQQKDPEHTRYFCALWKAELVRDPDLLASYDLAKTTLRCDELEATGSGE